MGYHQQTRCSQHGCLEISKRKHQTSYGKSTCQDDPGENDHFSSMIFIQELLMDPKNFFFL
jgi:hypothetical protein